MRKTCFPFVKRVRFEMKSDALKSMIRNPKSGVSEPPQRFSQARPRPQASIMWWFTTRAYQEIAAAVCLSLLLGDNHCRIKCRGFDGNFVDGRSFFRCRWERLAFIANYPPVPHAPVSLKLPFNLGLCFLASASLAAMTL